MYFLVLCIINMILYNIKFVSLKIYINETWEYFSQFRKLLAFSICTFFLHRTDLRTLFHWFLFINLSIKLYISRLNYYSSSICILIFMLIYTLITSVGNANSKLKNITNSQKSSSQPQQLAQSWLLNASEIELFKI